MISFMKVYLKPKYLIFYYKAFYSESFLIKKVFSTLYDIFLRELEFPIVYYFRFKRHLSLMLENTQRSACGFR